MFHVHEFDPLAHVVLTDTLAPLDATDGRLRHADKTSNARWIYRL
jgi:hypothetical protein